MALKTEEPKTETPVEFLEREFKKIAFLSHYWPRFQELVDMAKEKEARISWERSNQKRHDLSKF